MNVAEYLVKCPVCRSEIRLVAEESNPIVFSCYGCNRSVVLHNNRVFTVDRSYFKKLLARYPSKACGRILCSKVSEEAGRLITEDKIEVLHNLLEGSRDVKEFLTKI